MRGWCCAQCGKQVTLVRSFDLCGGRAARLGDINFCVCMHSLCGFLTWREDLLLLLLVLASGTVEVHLAEWRYSSWSLCFRYVQRFSALNFKLWPCEILYYVITYLGYNSFRIALKLKERYVVVCWVMVKVTQHWRMTYYSEFLHTFSSLLACVTTKSARRELIYMTDWVKIKNLREFKPFSYLFPLCCAESKISQLFAAKSIFLRKNSWVKMSAQPFCPNEPWTSLILLLQLPLMCIICDSQPKLTCRMLY